MLATPGDLPISSGEAEWAYEVKWDGMRALATIVRGRVKLSSRSEMDVTSRFREIAESPALTGLPEGTIVDGEIVAFDENGRPSFSLLAPRIQGHRRNAMAVAYIAFDLLCWGDDDQMQSTYGERRERLAGGVLPAPFVQVPEPFDDGPALLATTELQGLEGVVAKRRDSRYEPGVRSAYWVKVPHRRSHSYVIGGWKHGSTHSQPLASLLVGTPTADGLLTYDGAVGSGLSGQVSTTLLAVLAEIRRSERPFHWATALPDESEVTWVQPYLVVDVEHLGRTGGRLLRAPSVARLRPDLTYDDLWQHGTGAG